MVIIAVLLGYALNALLSVIDDGLRGAHLLWFVACLAVALPLQVAHSALDPLAWPVRARVVTLSAQAVVTFVPFVWVGPQAGALAGFLAGSMLLAVSGAARWWLYGGVATVVLLGLWSEGLAAVDIGYGAYFTLLTGLMVYAVSSLESLVGLVYAARGDLAWMAVARERLRVARDLHDLLGSNVSAMALKSELAYRLLPAAAERARAELHEVLGMAKRALADMRIVADGDRRMSMAAELEFARATCEAAQIRVEAALSVPDLPEDLDTVLAIVLREAVTNVLRHSAATRCLVESDVDGGWVRLSVRNDGAGFREANGEGQGGSGLANIESRLSAVGGRVEVDVADGWFRLTATAPVPAAAMSSGPAGSGPGAPGPTAAARPSDPAAAETGGQRWHLRAARTIATIVLAGYGLLVIVNVLAVRPSGAELLGFVACVAVLVGVQIVHALRDPARWPPWTRAASVGLQVAASAVPLLWIGQPWGSMGGFVAGSMLMVLSGPARWVAYGAVAAAVLALSLLHHDATGWTAYLTISTLLTGLVVYGISSLASLVKRVDNARSDLARVAVTRERLRMERELQSQLGEHLATMTSRAELAFRLLPGSPGRAKVVLAETLDIAHESVTSVRSVASGYRHMSLSAEVDSAVSALGSAGVKVDLSVGAVPRHVDGLLAVVLREAVANVVRHSAARRCTIAVAERGTCVELTVTNDGVPLTAGLTAPDLRGGAGLGDLADRLRSIGGTLTVASNTGEFRIVATVPGADSARAGEHR